ncbi:hypothetical protein [Cellulomonas massiliensis]|uniref:hypothetical protein n=1 Tax=Cellulomonas massiliensis TaxID=1465811 RepID=UPI0002DFE99E|nr:hypothetical protein [Cellulomonas massiliensis]
MTPEQEAVLAQIVAALPQSAPAGWLRIVSRREGTVAEGPYSGSSVDVVVVQTPAGLEQRDYRDPEDLYWTVLDLMEDLARSSSGGSVVLSLVVDRDGTSRVDLAEEAPKVLEGVRDESSSVPVHEYLERNRAELEELAARLGAAGA